MTEGRMRLSRNIPFQVGITMLTQDRDVRALGLFNVYASWATMDSPLLRAIRGCCDCRARQSILLVNDSISRRIEQHLTMVVSPISTKNPCFIIRSAMLSSFV